MKIIQRITQSSFLKYNAIFFFGSVGVGILNYLYYPILGRLMEPAAFGEVQTLVSLFLQLTVFLNVLNLVVVTIVVNYKDKILAGRTLFELEKLALFAALGLTGISIALSPLLKNTLQFDSAIPFTALALAVLVSVPLAFRTGQLRAKQQFGTVSMAMAIGAAGKIILSAALVVAGMGALGAMLGIAGAQLIALTYAAVLAIKAGFMRPQNVRYASRIHFSLLGPELRHAAAVLGGSLAIMLLLSIDMLAVKYYFDPETAGQYAGVTTVARAIFFFTASITLVLLPSVKLTNAPAQNRALLVKSLALLTAIGGAGVLACTIAPQFIIRILMGGEYLVYASLLPWLALAMFIISVLNLFFMYFLALRLKMVALIAIMGFVATVTALLVNHDSLRAVVGSILIGSIITMCLLGTYIITSNVRRKSRTTNKYSVLSGAENSDRNGQAATHIDHRTDLQ